MSFAVLTKALPERARLEKRPGEPEFRPSGCPGRGCIPAGEILFHRGANR